MKKRKLLVVISLDVEEEGLFSGIYRTTGTSVENVACLPLLAPLTRELGFPLTLFCAYSVFASEQAKKIIARMRDDYGAEVGAHLHHWSTPPLGVETAGPPERTDKLPKALLAKRLHSLLEAGAAFQGAPLTSFRMGRWDLKAQLLPLLAENDITVDSSICPLRATRGGPNHFLAPTDPWWVNLGQGQQILEAPITQIPLFSSMPLLWQKIAPEKYLDKFHFFGALSANPFWHNGSIMRLAASLHSRRGGKVLNLFWHSSEMMPGASPKTPDERAANLTLSKIFSFCRWLKDNFEIEGITASQLASCHFPERQLAPNRDW